MISLSNFRLNSPANSLHANNFPILIFPEGSLFALIICLYFNIPRRHNLKFRILIKANRSNIGRGKSKKDTNVLSTSNLEFKL